MLDILTKFQGKIRSFWMFIKAVIRDLLTHPSLV